MSRPKLHPVRQPRGPRFLYCRLCDEDILVTERSEHDASDPHAALAAAYRREEFLDRLIPYSCPGRVLFFYPGAAQLDSTLYDARVLQGRAVVADRGVSPAAHSGR